MAVRILETGARLILLVLVGLRPLVAETYDSAPSMFAGALEGLSDPTPVRTWMLDLLIVASGSVVALTRVLRPVGGFRRTGLEVGLILLVVASAVSSLAAGNQRLAINASFDWLCYPVLAILLAQVLGTRFHRRLLLAVVLASSAVQAVECVDQYFFSFENTRAFYESNKAEFWAKQGVPLDAPQVELYERRLLARDAQGSFGHPAVAGSYLVLCAWVAGAVGLSSLRAGASLAARLRGGTGLAFAGFLIFAACLTGSRGALLAAAAGAVVAVVLWASWRWVMTHRARVWAIGWTCVALGVAAGVGHGLWHGSLPGPSLAFRWEYWTNSARMIADYPITGVGRENFGRHYLQYKPIESPEEIQNPHNLFVQATAEWGVVGLAGILAMLIGGSRVQAGVPRRLDAAGAADRTAPAFSAGKGEQRAAMPAPPTPPSPSGRRGVAPGGDDAGHAWVWGLVVGAAVVGLRLLLLGTKDFNYLYATGVITALAWLGGYALFAPRAAEGETHSPEARPAGTPSLICCGVGIGLLAFLLHELINFALFVPGAATTCFALFGCLAATTGRARATAEPKRHVQTVWVVVAVLLPVGTWGFGVSPVDRCVTILEYARASQSDSVHGPPSRQPAHALFRMAGFLDRRDPTPAAEEADWLLSLPAERAQWRVEALAEATESIEEAIARDPWHASLRRLQARIFLARAEVARDGGLYEAAVAAAREALRLYPQDPTGLVLVGDCELAAGQALNSTPHLEAALKAYQESLALDARRPAWEVIRRFSPRMQAEIEARIETVRTLLDERTPRP
ncbi:MAG TPA: O-antigen ligase family protein [Phycisphaerae bacterium]|nr:O-antigen ligase family protein [Phycisphaerae bacterium]HNU43675.1 O-antigen ligase family protein [Phycisphaerae bacterium]